ncbi:hypothetical protein BJX68DRAFT_266667 [Aspergillus pseudodeflectus]|uniref:Uncharacterized protein n=1 Tax=Aspergillus pseudodeflectus TaxID=176178 RepID=A0ABR4KDW1_9EURO
MAAAQKAEGFSFRLDKSPGVPELRGDALYEHAHHHGTKWKAQPSPLVLKSFLPLPVNTRTSSRRAKEPYTCTLACTRGIPQRSNHKTRRSRDSSCSGTGTGLGVGLSHNSNEAVTETTVISESATPSATQTPPTPAPTTLSETLVTASRGTINNETVVLYRDCPSSNNTLYSVTSDSTATYQFRKACNARVVHEAQFPDLVNQVVASLNECMNLCARYNRLGHFLASAWQNQGFGLIG